MATKGERQALLFLVAVAMLGAGVRMFRANHVVAADTTAVDRQLAAVDRARASRGKRKPGARVPRAPRPRAPRPTTSAPGSRIDIDRATTDEITKLPGIGPALARRIVSDRDAHGPFGCLAALDAVKGIGPAMLGRLDSLVSFSGPGRAPCGG